MKRLLQWLACGTLQNSQDQVAVSALSHSWAFTDREGSEGAKDPLNVLGAV